MTSFLHEATGTEQHKSSTIGKLSRSSIYKPVGRYKSYSKPMKLISDVEPEHETSLYLSQVYLNNDHIDYSLTQNNSWNLAQTVVVNCGVSFTP